MDAAERNVFGTGGGFGGGGGIQGSGSHGELPTPQTFGHPTFNAAPPSSAPNQSASASADCHYFLQGTCTKVSMGVYRVRMKPVHPDKILPHRDLFRIQKVFFRPIGISRAILPAPSLIAIVCIIPAPSHGSPCEKLSSVHVPGSA